MLRTRLREQLMEVAAGFAEVQPVAANRNVRNAMKFSAHALAFQDVAPSAITKEHGITGWSEERAILILSSAMKQAGFEVNRADEVAQKVIHGVIEAHENFLYSFRP